MKTIATFIGTLAIAGTVITGTAVAQQRSVSTWVDDMRTKYGKTFEQCQSLATARGYRLGDNEFEARPIMMFIEGCIVGKQA
jgi:hypothetical protein